MYFEINGISFDKNVQRSTYQVNEADEYTEWTDANGKKHRSIYRTRVSGTFSMAFLTAAEHQSFLNNLKIATSESGTKMKVHAQNTNKDKEIIGFYTILANEYIDLGNGYIRDIVQVEVEEA